MSTTPIESLEDQLQTALDEHKIPGGSVAVLSGDRVWAAAAGVANLDSGERVTENTPFQIGSTTKSLTATLAMQLVEKGAIELDAPVQRYLPDLRLADPADRITVRHLLTHTSGIKGDFFVDVGDDDNALAKYVEALRDVPILYEPGKFYSYCNAGYPLLGRVCEVVSGEVWDNLLKTRLFQPLGMARSASLSAEKEALGVAVGYDRNRQGELKRAEKSTRSTGPSGSTVASTARDLVKFARLHLDLEKGGAHRGVLSEQTVRAMQTPQVSVPGHSFADYWGLGWMLMNWDDVMQYGHDGATAGNLSLFRVFPQRGVAIALQCNAGDGGGFIRSVAGKLFRDLVNVDFPKPPAPTGRKFDLRPYEGTYERYFARLEVEAGDGELICRGYGLKPSGELVSPEPVQIIRLKPCSAETFVEAAPDGRQPQSTEFLEFDASGSPQFLFSGARALKRVNAGGRPSE